MMNPSQDILPILLQGGDQRTVIPLAGGRGYIACSPREVLQTCECTHTYAPLNTCMHSEAHPLMYKHTHNTLQILSVFGVNPLMLSLMWVQVCISGERLRRVVASVLQGLSERGVTEDRSRWSSTVVKHANINVLHVLLFYP